MKFLLSSFLLLSTINIVTMNLDSNYDDEYEKQAKSDVESPCENQCDRIDISSSQYTFFEIFNNDVTQYLKKIEIRRNCLVRLDQTILRKRLEEAQKNLKLLSEIQKKIDDILHPVHHQFENLSNENKTYLYNLIITKRHCKQIDPSADHDAHYIPYVLRDKAACNETLNQNLNSFESNNSK